MNTQSSPLHILSKAVGAVLIIAALAWGSQYVWHHFWNEPGGAAVNFAERLAKDTDKVLHFRPKITVNEFTIIYPDSNISEFATATRPIYQEYDYKATWGGSTKEIKLGGDFIAKAGYKLPSTFLFYISKDAKPIHLTFPDPELLSDEEVHHRVLVDENGFWNKITPQEREDAQNALKKAADDQAAKSGILKDADQNLMAQMEGIIRPNAPAAVNIIRDPPALH